MQQLFSQTKVSRYASLPLLLLATKSYLPTPSVEVSTREVKRIAELDQHIERHHEAEGFAPSLVIDQVLANSS
jgi:hypothetical protein